MVHFKNLLSAKTREPVKAAYRKVKKEPVTAVKCQKVVCDSTGITIPRSVMRVQTECPQLVIPGWKRPKAASLHAFEEERIHSSAASLQPAVYKKAEESITLDELFISSGESNL